MKTWTKTTAVAVVLLAAATGANAAQMAAELPARTLADFQKQYAATKPVVAVQKFWEYEALKATPRPTLAVSHMRTEGDTADISTKPVLGME